MHARHMADGGLVADQRGMPAIRVDDRAVLDVRAGADADWFHVAAKDDTIPHRGTRPDFDIPQ
jgi:hypothetical protein